MTNYKDYKSPAHNSDICISHFIFIFQCILMYYHYFRFISLPNASNCPVIKFSVMISFMNFFSYLKMPVDINTWRAAIGLFGNVTMGSSIFYLTACFRWIPYSILLLLTILFLLFTVPFYDKDLGMMASLSLHVNSINIKGSFWNKFSMKCCTCPHLCFSVDYYYSYQWYCYSFLKI